MFVQSGEDPFVRMGKEEATPIVAEVPHHTDEQVMDTPVDPFIVGDAFHHEEPEEAVVVESHPVEKIQEPVEEIAPQKQPITDSISKNVPIVQDPVTVVEPPLEPEHIDISPIPEEREAEPEKDLSPMLQKLDTLIHNIRAIIAEDGRLESGIPVIGGNSGVSHVDYVVSLDDSQT